ncbi:podocalyxin [Fundulus heteroclitus]|uniref:podocalyxin n=1 Tax=Fundulus heteroclitus TaxID=8078 RepID=UPI00165B37B9|nr:podocalyxin [Fundulus heteroclitus]
MRGTLRITWLLLSLSICSVSGDGTTSKPEASLATTVVTAGGTTPKSSAAAVTSVAPTEGKPTTAAPSVTSVQAVDKATASTQRPVATTTTRDLPVTPSTAAATQSATKASVPPAPASTADPRTAVTAAASSALPTAKATSPATVTSDPKSQVSGQQLATTNAGSSGGPKPSPTQPGDKGAQTTPEKMVTVTATPSAQTTPESAQTMPTTIKRDSSTGTTRPIGANAGWPSAGPTSPNLTTERTMTSSRTSTVGDSNVIPTTQTQGTTSTAPAETTVFKYSLNDPKLHQNPTLVDLCTPFIKNMQNATCTLKLENGEILYDSLEVTGKVDASLVKEEYRKIKEATAQKQTDNKTLVAILVSCGALLLMIIILGFCVSHRRKPYNENQLHLTDELHTVENGYHDNPTLEVMEGQPEMQEKSMALNGEFSDSWIVPIDNLMKDMPDEEDTHL